MEHTHHIAVNGWDCSAIVVTFEGGYRVQFLEEEWEYVGSWRGDLVTVRLPNGGEAWMTVASVTQLPPVVWVVFTASGRKTT